MGSLGSAFPCKDICTVGISPCPCLFFSSVLSHESSVILHLSISLFFLVSFALPFGPSCIFSPWFTTCKGQDPTQKTSKAWADEWNVGRLVLESLPVTHTPPRGLSTVLFLSFQMMVLHCWLNLSTLTPARVICDLVFGCLFSSCTDPRPVLSPNASARSGLIIIIF